MSSSSTANLQQQQQLQQPTPPPIAPRNNQSILSTNNFSPQQFQVPQLNTNNNNYFNSGSYGNFPSAYSRFSTNTSSNSFLRAAEESSRSAFQSIESVVHAFTAVSAMFESTYYAVFNSFRAVVGVADQFYRLKTHLSGVLSALAVVRVFKFIYRKIKRLLRLGKLSSEDLSVDSAWNSANGNKHLSEVESFIKETSKRQTNWPVILFFAVVFGGPWVIWKILSSIESINKDDSLWMSGKIEHFIAVSEFDFDSLNVDEISFRKGQRIIIAPKGFSISIKVIFSILY